MANEKLIKILSDWPLSKVELVEIDGGKCIRKTIHKDFKDEYFRQKYLFDNLKWTKVPKVYDLAECGKDKVTFLMDFVDIAREVTDHEAVELLMDFQGEARKLKDKSFPVYNFQALQKDLKVAEQYGVSLNPEEYSDIFQGDVSIAHGDFGNDQMVIDKNDDLFLLDFGKSYIGPTLLDFAYYARRDEDAEKMVRKLLGYRKTDHTFIKTKIINALRQIAWFHLCQTKYIKDHDYVNNEIKKEVELIKQLESELTLEVKRSCLWPFPSSKK